MNDDPWTMIDKRYLAELLQKAKRAEQAEAAFAALKAKIHEALMQRQREHLDIEAKLSWEDFEPHRALRAMAQSNDRLVGEVAALLQEPEPK